MVVVVAVLLTIEAGFRCGTAFIERPPGQPGWMHSKAAYYCFVYMMELIVVYLFMVAFLDRGFKKGGEEPMGVEEGRRKSRLAGGVNRRSDVFG